MTTNQDAVAGAKTAQGTFEAHSAGAQVSRWDSETFGPLLFVSSATNSGVGSTIRGGIPLCFPWFGAFRDHYEGAPLLGVERGGKKHGFARNLNWRLVADEVGVAGAWLVRYELDQDDVPIEEAPGDVSPLPFHATLEALFSDTLLDLTFTVKNTGEGAFQYEEAVHTYFAVADLTGTEVTGLEGVPYLDKAPGGVDAVQEGPITFPGMVDRVYQSPAPAVIMDRGNSRQIRIVKEHSGTTIVWNPGPEAAREMADLGEGEYRRFICVESGNALDNAITLQPGEEHTMRVRYEVAKI
ncbi:D-hexose-6-phosphate mutarotase [Actinomyces minihominis]|uniref:D-hexose-6-phosphate mutarotase n=1 Tax=Actinomyces minihominis TaxID=2002838 RepID=UPI000C08C064|nr:D-hexose-6-phosphate mutarotase [Actinomyces minihominis]